MTDSSPSLKDSDLESPDAAGDVEMKSDGANGVQSDSDAVSVRSAKRKTPEVPEDDEVAMADGADELFGSDDNDAEGPGAHDDGDA